MFPIVQNIEIVSYAQEFSSREINQQRRSELGQYMTPSSIADFMASLFKYSGIKSIRLLDPGAGLGALSSAFARNCFLNGCYPELEITAYEVDPYFKKSLEDEFRNLEDFADRKGLSFSSHMIEGDFVEEAVNLILSKNFRKFSHAIINPPYKKIQSQSKHRKLLHEVEIETVNLYAAFLALAISLLADKGELVAIIPRSFCSGSYYKSFREFILKKTSISQIHLFNARDKAFQKDEVLQENVIIHLIKGGEQKDVVLSFSNDDSFFDYNSYLCQFENILNENDGELFIRIPLRENLNELKKPSSAKYSLSEIGIEISTGPVVDFRLKEFLCAQPELGSVPLLYPCHFDCNYVCWPNEKSKKPNALRVNSETERWLWPNGFYVVVRRMSSKEEKRRIVASVVNPEFFNYPKLGFENHLNVFHFRKNGLDKDLAYGLAVFLNSSQIDNRFRSFNGHTQVNATDLRSLKYPDKEILKDMGKWAQICVELTQEEIDQKIEQMN